MQEMNVTVEFREKSGVKGALSSARRNKKVPAVLYGGTKPPVAITVARKDIDLLAKTGGNTLINLATPQETDKVILKTVQYHVVSGEPIHADFQRIAMDKKIEIKVPVVLKGEAPGIKLHGYLLDHVSRELAVSCLPSNMPQEITVDISKLEHGSITAADIKMPEGIEIVAEASRLIVHLIVPRGEEAATPAAGAAATTEAAQPEVIAKGKKEEEGAEGAAAKPGAKTDAKPEAKADAKAEKKK